MDGGESWAYNSVVEGGTDGRGRIEEHTDVERRRNDVELNEGDMDANRRGPMGEELEKKKKVEKPEDDTEDKSTGMNDSFLCYICLELVRKPVVNACGHMFCFWCVHYSMNQYKESYCPLCRRPYKYFPRVCELLHFFLLKAIPHEYRERCRDSDDDRSMQSPHYGDDVNSDSAEPIASIDAAPMEEVSLSQHLPPTSEIGVMRPIDEGTNVTIRDCCDEAVMGCVDPVCSSSTTVEQQGVEYTEKGRGDPVTGASVPNSSSPCVTVADLLCGSCAKLLYHPVVLNCGHVFCERCLATTEDEDGLGLTCTACGSAHPGDFPLVCLELHHFLEQHFSLEYGMRRRESEAQLREVSSSRSQSNVGASDSKASDASEKSRMSATPRHPRGQRTHRSVGCDGCGMYPILGQRFRCTACPTPPGYDLCLDCYKSGKDLLGRFNQQHTREHHLESYGDSSGARISVRQLFRTLNSSEVWGSLSLSESLSEEPEDSPYSEEQSGSPYSEESLPEGGELM